MRPGDAVVVVAATGAFVAGARAVRRDGVSEAEACCFGAVNGLPKGPFPAVWAVMQLGSLAGALGAGTSVALAGRPALGRRVAAAGALTWVAAKMVKHLVGRGRPRDTLTVARILGREPGGLGYPSGHAAVAASVAAVAAPALSVRWRPLLWAAALAVGPARMYVGVHLPLDVAGGVAFGIAAGTLVNGLAPRS